MRKLLGSALVLAVLVFAGTAAAAAQSDVRFGLGAGVVIPMGDYSDDVAWGDKLGFLFGAGASIGLGTAPVRIRVEGSYSQTAHDSAAWGGVDGNTKILGGMASVVYPFETAGKVKPYVLAGIGYYSVKESILDESESGVGFGGGAGLMLAAGSANILLEVRYLTSKAGGLNFARLPIMVGVSFGGAKKM